MEKIRADELHRKLAVHNETALKLSLRREESSEHLRFAASMGIHQGQLEGQFAMVGQDDVLYYVSNTLVINNIADGSSLFLQKQGRLRNVTALASTYRDEYEREEVKWFIAAGESTLVAEERKSVITLITIPTEGEAEWRTLQTNHRSRINSIELNYSKKLCGCLMVESLSGVPLLLVWKLGKDQLLASYTFKPTECHRFSFDPHNQRQVLTMNDSCVRLWEINAQERTLKERQAVLRDFKEACYRDWIWLVIGQQAILVVISKTKVFVVAAGQLRASAGFDRDQMKIRRSNVLQKEIERSLEQIYQMKQIFDYKLKQAENYAREEEKDQLPDNRLELCCVMHKSFGRGKERSRSVVMVGASNGLVLLYELDRRLQLSHVQSFQVGNEATMHSVSINRTATVIGCVSRHIGTQELHFDLVRTSMFDTEEAPITDFIGEGVHSSTILSLSAAVMKDVFVSSSADRTIRVWNYGNELDTRSVLSVRFKEEPLDAALHPLGMLLAVNFKTEIRVFSVLSSQLHPLKSIRHVEDCRWLRFSHHGHFLISNQYSSIKFYEAVNFKLVSCYEVDQNRAWLVRCYLTADDEQLVVVLNTGATYVIDVLFGQQGKLRLPDKPDHLEPYGYRNIVYDNRVRQPTGKDAGSQLGSLFVGSNQYKYFSIYRNRCRQLIAEFPVGDCSIESMCLAKEVSMLLVGTSNGSVRMYAWPIDEASCMMEVIGGNQVRLQPPNFYELMVHARHVKSIEIRDDCQYAITGGDDGTIAAVELYGLDDRRSEKNREQLIKFRQDRKKLMSTMNSLFLMRASDVQSKNDLIRKSELDVLRAEQAISRQRSRRLKQLEQLRERNQKELQQSLQHQNQLRDQNLDNESNEIKRLQQMYSQSLKEFQEESEHARLEHNRKKQYELQRNQQVRVEIEQLKIRHKDKLEQLIARNKAEITRIRNDFKQKNDQVRQTFEQLLEEAEQAGLSRPPPAETLQIQCQADESVVSLKEEIEQLRLSNQLLKQKNDSVQRNYQQSKREDERMQIQFQQLFEKHNELRLRNLKSDEQIIKLQHQLLERLQVIDFKEEACREGREYQRNLQNFKFVLDDKIGGLQKDKQRILENIHEKEQELEKMFNELIEESNRNEQRQQEIAQLDGRLTVCENEVRRGQLRIVFNMNRLTTLQQRLETLLQVDCPNRAAIMLRQIIEEASDQKQLTTLLRKSNLNHKDIREVARMKQQNTSNENEQLLKYGKWMTKKLNLMKITSKKVRDIKEGNINIVLKQNQRLLEECNELRTENHAYDRQIDRAQYMIEDISRQEQNYRAMRAEESNFGKLQRRFLENQKELELQHKKLNDMFSTLR